VSGGGQSLAVKESSPAIAHCALKKHRLKAVLFA